MPIGSVNIEIVLPSAAALVRVIMDTRVDQARSADLNHRVRAVEESLKGKHPIRM